MNNIFFHNVYVVTKSTFKESVRDKVLYAILAFAFIFISFSIFLGSISLGQDLHVVRSIGLAGIYLFGLLLSIFLGATLVYKELERRTLYFVLSKPITHGQFILGKFFGLFASVALSIAGMAVVYLGVVAFEGGGFDSLALLAVLFELFELGLLIAISIFFSTCTRPLAATIYTILAVYVGHSLSTVVDTTTRLQNTFFIAGAKVMYYLLPNLEKFDIRDMVVYYGVPTHLEVLAVFGYALVYTAILLLAATILLKKREL
jgi:ABC-type transport system involved in multi-copper enzyme maturation permease subunit